MKLTPPTIVLAGLGLLATPGVARAAGYYLTTRGAQSMARGGANVVSPDHLDALWNNPAGLVGQEGLELQVDFYLGHIFSTFARADDPPVFTGFEPVASAGTPFISLENPIAPDLANGTAIFPSGFGATWGLGALTLGLGIQGPLRANERYPADGPQRYSVITSIPIEVHYQAAVAYRVAEGLDVGLAFKNVYFSMRQSLAMSADLLGTEDPGMDAIVDVRAQQAFNPSFTFGLTGRPLPWLELAAAYSPGLRVKAAGTLTPSFGDTLAALAPDLTLSSDAIYLGVRLPPVAQAGLRLVQPRWDLELALAYEGWGVFEEIAVDTRGMTLSSATLEAAGLIAGPLDFGTLAIERHWRDTWRLALGGQYELLEGTLAARGGLFYERGAIPPQWLDVSRLDLDKLGVAAGVRLALAPFFIDLAAGYIYSPPLTVSDSEVRLVHALDPQAFDEPIANGDYTAAYLVASLAVGVRLPGL